MMRPSPCAWPTERFPFLCEREHRNQDYAEGHTTLRQLPENVPSVPDFPLQDCVLGSSQRKLYPQVYQKSCPTHTVFLKKMSERFEQETKSACTAAF